MKVALVLVFSSVALFSANLFAQDEGDREPASVDQSTTEEERARVKKRLFPGGRDEEPLQVQEQLPVSGRAGVVDEPADPEDHD